jgi:hypothetical protein
MAGGRNGSEQAGRPDHNATQEIGGQRRGQRPDLAARYFFQHVDCTDPYHRIEIGEAAAHRAFLLEHHAEFSEAVDQGGSLSAFSGRRPTGAKSSMGSNGSLATPPARPRAESQAGGRIISQRFETFRRAARTLRMAAKPKYSILNKASHIDRLSDQIKGLREKAKGLPAGDERDALLRKAEQDEIALRLIEWITSSGQLPPPADLIPIRRHRLRRE